MVDEGRRKARPTRVSRNGTIVLAATARRAAGIEPGDRVVSIPVGPGAVLVERVQGGRAVAAGASSSTRTTTRFAGRTAATLRHTSTSCADRGASNAPEHRSRRGGVRLRHRAARLPAGAKAVAGDPRGRGSRVRRRRGGRPRLHRAGRLRRGAARAPLRARPARRLGGGWAPPLPGFAVCAPELGTAHSAARHVAGRTMPRLADALVAATAAELRLPLVTGDRRLARAASALLVHDFA